MVAEGQGKDASNTERFLTSAYIKCKYRNLLTKHIKTQNNILRIE